MALAVAMLIVLVMGDLVRRSSITCRNICGSRCTCARITTAGGRTSITPCCRPIRGLARRVSRRHSLPRRRRARLAALLAGRPAGLALGQIHVWWRHTTELGWRTRPGSWHLMRPWESSFPRTMTATTETPISSLATSSASTMRRLARCWLGWHQPAVERATPAARDETGPGQSLIGGSPE
jgi:hypothetical protein